MQFLLIICYPVFAHLAVMTQVPMLHMLAILSLSSGILFKWLCNGQILPWGLLCLISLSVAMLSYLNMGDILIYASSMIILILLFIVFFHSLFPGHTPLVTDIGEKTRGPLTEAMRHYTRTVTIVWASLFGVMVTWSILLAWLGSPSLWSLFSNVINYILVGSVFLGEFLFRKWHFPDHDHPNFFQYIRIVIQANIGKA